MNDGVRTSIRRTGLAWLAVVGLSACGPDQGSPPGGDFALLAQAVEGFEEARPGVRLVFPRDHGPHPGYRIEWWYVTANLRDASGNPYGAQWTLFRLATRPPGTDVAANPWHSGQVFMAHMALTWPEGHVGFARYARGGDHAGVAQAGAQPTPFAAWLDDWSLRSMDSAWLPLQTQAHQDDMGLSLRLDSQQPLVLQGDGGFSQKHHNGHGSFYYSQPFLTATGTLTIQGQAIAVSGQAWLDHEWSSQFLQPDQAGWDWFALHLDSGEKLMLFQLRARPGSLSAKNFQHGLLLSPNGEPTPLRGDRIHLEPLAFTSIAGRKLPLRWRVSLPQIGRTLDISALRPDQWMAADFAYWEGVIRVSGSDARSTGWGYLEMTGYPVEEDAEPE